MSTPPSEPGDLTLDSCYPLVKRYTRDELPQPLTASIRDGKEPQLIGPGRQRGRHRLGQPAPLRFGQEGRSDQTENEEQADDRGDAAIPAEADDQASGDQRPTHEMKRGALKLNATAVARMRVGNSSGSQIGCPSAKPQPAVKWLICRS